MKLEQLSKAGRDIESASFQIIENEIKKLEFEYDFTAPEWEIIRRVIHTTGDFDYKRDLHFHQNAVMAGVRALCNSCKVFVDVEMIAAGINRKRSQYFAISVHSFIADEDVLERARFNQTTRAHEAVNKAYEKGLLDGAIIAIGNTPTSLIRIVELIKEKKIRPALVIGVPVGFVSALESKEMLVDDDDIKMEDVPFITVRGRKGGSTVAVAIIHALMSLASESVSKSNIESKNNKKCEKLKKCKAVTVIGVGTNGCSGITPEAFGKVMEAEVLFAAERLLDFFPQFKGEKISIKSSQSYVSLEQQLRSVVERSYEQNVVILSSGDPLFFGVAKTLLELNLVESNFLEIIPHPSSMQIAFARIGVSWEDACWISLHGKVDLRYTDGLILGLANKIKNKHKVAILSDYKFTPVQIAKYLLDFHPFLSDEWQLAQAVVAENLESVDEKITYYSLQQLAREERDFSSLCILILLKNREKQKERIINCRSEKEYTEGSDSTLCTKKEIRLMSLDALEISANDIIWDVGAGSGSIAIEAAELAYNGKVYAVEMNLQQIAICRSNIYKFATDNVQLFEGEAPSVFDNIIVDGVAGVDSPDGVFIGGHKGKLAEIIISAHKRLRVGGRLVINAVTLESVSIALQTLALLGYSGSKAPEVTLINISRTSICGNESNGSNYNRYNPLNPIHLFKVKKI
ncbi:MAG: precorrin-6y C5,15-methyltransferase (decarboxylating) subunit CbiE [Oligoflexia bacterium]|nr:precorrin-6y C5,15-methyltransferase (decarboxylating) subunit CbiE [Oligoflexia bacterium]